MTVKGADDVMWPVNAGAILKTQQRDDRMNPWINAYFGHTHAGRDNAILAEEPASLTLPTRIFRVTTFTQPSPLSSRTI